MTRQERIAALKAAAKERVLILDGSWGVMFQKRGLTEADYRGDRFQDHPGQMKGNNDILCLTRPDIVGDLHDQYYAAGADISETNTFSATSIGQGEYAQEAAVRDINLAGARIAREVADRWTAKEPHKPRFVAGSIGPLPVMLSMSSDVNDPGARKVTFDQVYEAYSEQVRALHEGGVDLFLVETITDTLNCKAAIKAILDLEDEGYEPLPIWISGTITDRSGRTLSGQTVEAFWNSVRHAKPFAIGLNCALGADLMRPHIAELSRIADTLVSAYPNAGLPNAMGEYDEEPHETGHQLHDWAQDGIVNILGGCCGTTPDHIRHVADAVRGMKPRQPAERPKAMRLAGLEPFEIAWMKAPDWYDAWCEDAFAAFTAKQERMQADYRLAAWTRYDYDAEACSLTFSDERGPRVVADIQVIGTIGEQDWMWGWANANWPSQSTDAMRQVRTFGVENGVEELAVDVLTGDDLPGLGWMLAAISARVLEAEGAYRAPSGTGAVYLLIRSIKFVS